MAVISAAESNPLLRPQSDQQRAKCFFNQFYHEPERGATEKRGGRGFLLSVKYAGGEGGWILFDK